jgi:hypothetical protein
MAEMVEIAFTTSQGFAWQLQPIELQVSLASISLQVQLEHL